VSGPGPEPHRLTAPASKRCIKDCGELWYRHRDEEREEIKADEN
jgi:hypothetical protein